MAGKRRATNDLNRDNWDQEEPPEERGELKLLSASEVQSSGRKIIKARRTLGNRSQGVSCLAVNEI
jgi:nuclear pore complex protein Nup50